MSGYIPKPASTFPVTSNMGPRDTGIAGASKVHRGTDYATPCGTKISGPPAGCLKTGVDQIKGYGNTVQFDCGNGIKLQYAHLSSNPYNAQSNTITTGDSGVGACHLDFIITLDGKVVDGQCATGTVTGQYTYGNSSVRHGKKCPFSGAVNLCSDSVRDELKKHADSILNGTGKGDYTIGDGPTNPPDPHADDHPHEDQPPGDVIILGTGDGDGTGGVTSDPIVIDDPQPDPEEEDPEEPTPVEPYDPKASTPICDNSTCITQDNIDNAKHKHVTRTDANAHWEFLTPKGKCKQPTNTGATVYRQVPGDTVDYNDAFCTNQGCVYVNEGSGKGRCE